MRRDWASGQGASQQGANVCWGMIAGQGWKQQESAVSTGARWQRMMARNGSANSTVPAATRGGVILENGNGLTKKTGAPTPVLFEVHCLCQ